MKIAICGLIGSQNLGEKFISRSLSWLIADVIHEKEPEADLQFVEIDLMGRRNDPQPSTDYLDNKEKNLFFYERRGAKTEILYGKLKGLAKKCPALWMKNGVNAFRHFIWMHGLDLRKRLYRFFESTVSDADLIAIDGAGLLEYSYNEYQELLKTLTDFAADKGIPVIVNAIGRAGEFDLKDYQCKVLCAALRNPIVKYVSARDSAETVQACVGDRLSVKLYADAGFWLDRAFGAKHDPAAEVVGIGVIRGTALQSYDHDFTTDDWIKLFVGIARELQKRGHAFRLFTNGLKSDQTIGKRVIEELGLSEDHLVEKPEDAEVLMDTINSFGGLITCRMHSSIAAFTLGIPSVILSWNDKVNKYMDIIGYPERAIDLKDFDPVYIVDAYEKAKREGISPEAQEKMRALARQSVLDYSDLILELLHETKKN